MKNNESLLTIYICEQNLLKNCTEKLIKSKDEKIHDYILNIFDSIDEINRKLYKYINKNSFTKEIKANKNIVEELYEELDSLYLRINE